MSKKLTIMVEEEVYDGLRPGNDGGKGPGGDSGNNK